MTYRQLHGFVTVTEEGSFSRAAQKLFITQQSLRQQINALENEVGVPLLIRSPQGVRCTPAGQLFYENVKHLNGYMDQVIDECRRLDSQNKDILRVGIFSMPLLTPTVCFEFSRKYPLIEIRQMGMNSKDFYKLLLSNEVDVVEGSQFPVLSGTNLIYTKVTEFQPVCILKENHPLVGKAHIEMEDLIGYPVGVPDVNYFTRFKQYSAVTDQISFVDGIYGREAAASICIGGGTFIAMQPSAPSMRPFVAVPLNFRLIEAGLITRSELSPAVSLFVDEAIKAFNIFR